MRRTAVEQPRTLHRYRCWLALTKAGGRPVGTQAINRFRKQQRIGGCGNSRCWLCHGDKLAGNPTPKAQRHLLAFAEGMRDLELPARYR